ncbi:HAD phosphatase%2C family IIIA [uncultured Coprococcus sp.]|uniref:YqeG family HAD IIIA-type phosphatase n=1 Tax=Coprococcus ammoniilyticus TaxID=2981785 RepID=UPI000821A031|nr:YqeG family HAD IIIA-type phosphatase [Coprococcus ammoniilyticus]MCU6731014.1 YqeG family HAD IIIA-type phosphatase [Coprococcus ammoniilyticus]SCH89847.1 HAD phosphatase%2C family IIIA [uncultured Coprococcus sp.]
MFQKFYPSEYYTSTYVIDFVEYYKKGYRGILFDIDNTLVPHNAPATEEAIRLIHRLKEIGFGICLVSNNKEPRVAEFNKPLDVKYIYKAGKPKRSGYQKAMQLLGTDTTNTLFVGDQLFTDLWGANNTGITSLLVQPIDKKEEIQIILKRIPEKWILHSYLKKHQIVR